MTTKENRQDFAAYMRWLRHINASHPELPKKPGLARPTLLAFCKSLAESGRYGIGCYKSDTEIAKELEINNRARLGKYRGFAAEVGWFKPNGKRLGRVKGLDILIPEDEEISSHDEISEPVPEVDNAKHDASLTVKDCPACVPYIVTLRQGKLSIPEVIAIHTKGSA